ncbi:hypothetical protein GCM10007276_12780 [Agaricicola taiwanensis]|uniref:DUF2934 domain-containing protein n=1 Tax=Agaricicola taiwanensis TaxID=591372 RepID=A0A8J2VLL8_9RHOB|nr:DUF2934 domain-containing protein [Agaricicola taiwanensis]GGE36748.1 hypothetical protein GCM10007276_12780 [Agaricicola taiwanensis]
MDENERIRQRAHQIWIEEGKPEGRAEDHWQMARQLVAIEDAPGDDLKPNPLTEPHSDEAPVEEASIQENLGEFPTLTDQGEEQTVPKPRSKKSSGKASDKASGSKKTRQKT